MVVPLSSIPFVDILMVFLELLFKDAADWAPSSVRMGAENLAPTRV
jgi:hypothetical protein